MARRNADLENYELEHQLDYLERIATALETIASTLYDYLTPRT